MISSLSCFQFQVLYALSRRHNLFDDSWRLLFEDRQDDLFPEEIERFGLGKYIVSWSSHAIFFFISDLFWDLWVIVHDVKSDSLSVDFSLRDPLLVLMYSLVVTLPLLSALLAGTFGRFIGERGSVLITTGILTLSLILSILFYVEIHLECSTVEVL